MKVKDLIKQLSQKDLNKNLVVSSDEELNTLYTRWEVSAIKGRPNTLVLFPFSGSEE